MHFIIYDLELNQDFSSLQNFDKKRLKYPFEITQIGAIKLDVEFNTVATFNRFVKPTFYSKVGSFITKLTGITTEQLQNEAPFPEVYQAYTEFIGKTDAIFCIWGMSDIKELYRNAEDHNLDTQLLPKMFINLQPCVSKHLNLPAKTLLRLQHAVETLNIPLTYTFHNALYDAYYTTEIFKKIYNQSLQPKLYDPTHITIKARQRRRLLDVEKLLQQFEKMYHRQMTEEEQGMIKLAYKMGKTHQFLK